MAPSVSEQREQTHRRIIDAFWTLRSKMPIAQIKVRAIVDLANCSRGTFYQHFDSIYDLQEQAQQEVINDLQVYLVDNFVYLEAGSINEAKDCIATMSDRFAEKVSLLYSLDSNSSFTIEVTETLRPIIAEVYQFDLDNPRSIFKVDTIIISIITMLAYWFRQDKPISTDELANWLIRLIKMTAQTEYGPPDLPPLTENYDV